jgi:hypothetical protein
MQTWLNEEMFFIDVLTITWWYWCDKHDNVNWIKKYDYFGNEKLLVYGCIDFDNAIMCWCGDILYNDVNYIIMGYGVMHCRVYTWSPCIHKSWNVELWINSLT